MGSNIYYTLATITALAIGSAGFAVSTPDIEAIAAENQAKTTVVSQDKDIEDPEDKSDSTLDDIPTNPKGREIIEYAEKFLGVDYRWGGRDTGSHPGMDCQGVIFRPYASVFHEHWWDYPVDPRDMIKDPKLGEPIEGMDGILREDLKENRDKLNLLQEGDVLYFLVQDYMAHDQELNARCHVAEIEGKKYGCWHTALSLGGDGIIQANPGGVVQEDYIFRITFDALYASRRSE